MSDPLAPELLAAALVPLIATALFSGVAFSVAVNLLLLTAITASFWYLGSIEELLQAPVLLLPLSGLGLTYGFKRRTDIAAQRIVEQRDNFDAVTGLVSRTKAESELEKLLAREEARRESCVAVMYFDLDHFSLVSNVFGRDRANELLALSARALRDCTGPSAIVGRAGPDEFLVAVPGLPDRSAAASLALRLKKLLSKMNEDSSEAKGVETSVGVSIFPNDGHTGPELIASAEDALEHAKRAGKNAVSFSTCEMRNRRIRRQEIRQQFDNALANGEFELQYQPQFELDNRTIVGVEALVRWCSPRMGVVSPKEFIEIAEESGHIVAIGQWVLREACSQLAAWRKDGLVVGKMAVNVSALQIAQPTFVEDVLRATGAAGIWPSDLELEIRESVLIKNPSSVIKKLRKLSREGVRIALDDFGTGYSTLEYLASLPVNTIKIDKSFISRLKQLQTSGNDSVLVDAVSALAIQMRKSVVVESVETEAQKDFLLEVGCGFVQGYYFARPMGVKEVANLVQLGPTRPIELAAIGSPEDQFQPRNPS